jgi:hypothetical protein
MDPLPRTRRCQRHGRRVVVLALQPDR